jgi:hypothetical protein
MASDAAEPPIEDVVAKYKRLLTLARSSLEANQSTLAAKDKVIIQLQKALEEEKNNTKNNRRTVSGKDDESSIPRNLVRRVDVDDTIWLLVEHEGTDDSWMCFGSETELNDFVQRIPGAPLPVPQRSFSPAESQRIESESRKRVERVVEEFRRYKVRTEIARKNKDAETKLAAAQRTQSGTPASASSSSGNGGTLTSQLEKSLTDGTLGDATNIDELHRLKAQLTEQESKWRQAYEKVVKENELLRTRGGEAMLATQWRERYEACQREKDDLAEKLKLHMKSPMRGEGSNFGQKSIEQAYAELREEYKEFRRRMTTPSSNEGHQLMNESMDGSHSPGTINRSFNDSYYSPMPNGGSNYELGNVSSSGGSLRSMGLGESKIQYVRHMVFQYLSCKDASVKPHMESALIALFRYNETERAAIEEQRKADDYDTIASISTFLGSFTS